MAIKAIETSYKGYRFRSRLEARWAVFFDALGVEWEYEKEGYDLGDAGWYLPDFWLPRQGCWVEIKASGMVEKDEFQKAEFLSAGLEQPILLLIGQPDIEDSQQGFTALMVLGHAWQEWLPGDFLRTDESLVDLQYNMKSLASYLLDSREGVFVELCDLGPYEFDYIDHNGDLLSVNEGDFHSLGKYLKDVSLGNTRCTKDVYLIYKGWLLNKWGENHWSQKIGTSRVVEGCTLKAGSNGLVVIPENWGLLDNSIIRAINAAKSARFEHGESGGGWPRVSKKKAW
jgi:hypothetical protein